MKVLQSEMYGESRSELPLRDFVRWDVLNRDIVLPKWEFNRGNVAHAFCHVIARPWQRDLQPAQ